MLCPFGILFAMLISVGRPGRCRYDRKFRSSVSDFIRVNSTTFQSKSTFVSDSEAVGTKNLTYIYCRYVFCRHEYFNRLQRVLITSKPKHFTAGSARCLPQHNSSVAVAIPGVFDKPDCPHVDLGDTVKLQNGDFLKVTRYEKYTNVSSYQTCVVSGLLFRPVYKIIGLLREQPIEV